MGMPWHKTPNDMSVNFRFFGLNVVNQRHYLFLLMAKGRGVLDQDFNDADAAFAEQALNGLVANALNISRQRAVKLKQALLLAGLIDENWQPLDWDALHSERASYKETASKGASSGQAMTSTERSRKSRANKKIAATDEQRECNECNDNAAPCNDCNDDATACNATATFVQRNGRCNASKNSIKNQSVTNATLDRDLDVDLDLDLRLKNISFRHSESEGKPSTFRHFASEDDLCGADDASPASASTQTTWGNNGNTTIDTRPSNLQNLADKSVSATFVSESHLNGLKSQNNAIAESINQMDLTESTVCQENTQSQKQPQSLTSPLLTEAQETPKAAANAALPPSSAAPPTGGGEGRERCGKSRPPVPYQAIVDKYNALLPELPAAVALTPERKRTIQARWNAHPVHQDLEFWDEFFQTVRASDFLMGRTHNERNWRPNLDWLLNPRNFIKVVEGSYSQGAQ